MKQLLITALLATTLSAQPIHRDAIRAHMRFLADDLLEGRGAGTRGYDLAARYVATQFEAYGVEPGAGNSYFQRVPFRRTVPDPERSTITLTVPGREPVVLIYSQGFVTSGDALAAERRINAPIVFAGYGISAPSQKHDDYATIDVKGKIVLVLSGAPHAFPSTMRAHYSSSRYKMENALQNGAVGYMTFVTPEEEARAPWARVVRQTRLGAMHWVDANGVPQGISEPLAASLAVNPRVAETLFGGEEKLKDVFAQAKKKAPTPFALKATASVVLISRHEPLESANVVGIVRGSDPQLRDEAVVYTSHLDHLGITEPVNGDAINNGAFDNASGIAALLEMARSFATRAPKPRRSVLFVATTAEEKGLRGADYFANNPTIPFRNVVANINVDQIMMFRRVRDVVAIGAQHSDLGDAVATVGKKLGILLSEDPYPEEVIFVRSDQYPFVRRGIPALFIIAGHRAVDGANVLKEQREWFSSRYHQPSDDLSQPMDFSVPEMVARFSYEVGLEVANRAQRPRWKRGDFFGELFGKK